MALQLEDYALIGDSHTAALVGRNGSIDWLCLPRFDSAACFAALLGGPSHGRWLLSPSERFRTRRTYRRDTLVLESEHEVDGGAVRVTDFMTPRRGQARVVRLVEGIRDSVPMHMELCLRFDYGSAVPWLRQGRRGVTAVAGPDAVELRSDVPLEVTTGLVTADVTITAGERVAVPPRVASLLRRGPAADRSVGCGSFHGAVLARVGRAVHVRRGMARRRSCDRSSRSRR